MQEIKLSETGKLVMFHEPVNVIDSWHIMRDRIGVIRTDGSLKLCGEHDYSQAGSGFRSNDPHVQLIVPGAEPVLPIQLGILGLKGLHRGGRNADVSRVFGMVRQDGTAYINSPTSTYNHSLKVYERVLSWPTISPGILMDENTFNKEFRDLLKLVTKG